MERIKAIHQSGREATFTKLVWDMMSPGKNGWMEKGAKITLPDPYPIPQEILDYNKAKEDEPTLAQMRDYLTEKGVVFDSRLGFKKLKILYDANQE